jgi:hypothetical protein
MPIKNEARRFTSHWNGVVDASVEDTDITQRVMGNYHLSSGERMKGTLQVQHAVLKWFFLVEHQPQRINSSWNRQVQDGDQNEKKFSSWESSRCITRSERNTGSEVCTQDANCRWLRVAPNRSIGHCDVNSTETVGKPGKDSRSWDLSRAHGSLAGFS